MKPELPAENIRLERTSVDALLRLIDDRWTPAEVVLKRIQATLWSAKNHADWELRADLVCENCGKTMREHDGLAQCYEEATMNPADSAELGRA